MEQLSILSALITTTQKAQLSKIDSKLCKWFDNLIDKGYNESDFNNARVHCFDKYVKIILDDNEYTVKHGLLRFGMKVGETICYQTWYKCLHIIVSDLKFEVNYKDSKMQYFN